MVKVKIKNFQSISDCSFEIEGFTVVIGKNNLGKSAMIRAIDAALSNRTGDDFIRWGKTRSEVYFQKDGLEIEWVKGSKASYKVNSVPFTSLNRAVPQPILDAGIKKIEFGDKKINPLIAAQFNELFLVNEPGPTVTDALSVLYKLNILSDAAELCQKELRVNKSLLKTRESDLEELKSELKNFDSFEDLKKENDAIKVLSQSQDELQKEIAVLGQYETLINQSKRHLDILEKGHALNIPSIEEVSKKITEFQWIADITLRFKKMLQGVKNLEQASNTDIPEYKEVQELVQEYQWLCDIAAEFQATLQGVKNLEQFSKAEIPDYTSGTPIITDLQETSKYAGLLQTSVRATKTLKQKVEIYEGLSEMTSSLESMEALFINVGDIIKIEEPFKISATTVKNLSEQMKSTTDQLSVIQQEFDLYKVCPACGKQL